MAIKSCFVNFNGDGPTYRGLQYGMDICTGLVTGWVSFCFHHGRRHWIDARGNPTRYYSRVVWPPETGGTYKNSTCNNNRCSHRDSHGWLPSEG